MADFNGFVNDPTLVTNILCGFWRIPDIHRIYSYIVTLSSGIGTTFDAESSDWVPIGNWLSTYQVLWWLGVHRNCEASPENKEAAVVSNDGKDFEAPIERISRLVRKILFHCGWKSEFIQTKEWRTRDKTNSKKGNPKIFSKSFRFVGTRIKESTISKHAED
jgi:hypothetical protein